MSCIIDNNKIITTPIIDILNNLQQQLYLQHINKIDFIDIKQNNARVRCPIHSNGLERTPSCDILLVDKVTNYLGKKNIVNAGTVHCFGCGYHANIVKFVNIDDFKNNFIFPSFKYKLSAYNIILKFLKNNNFYSQIILKNIFTLSEY